jgi:hypothetical protein
MIILSLAIGFFFLETNSLAAEKKETPQRAIKIDQSQYIEVKKEADLEIDAVFLEDCAQQQYDGQDILVFKNAIVKYSNNGPRDYDARVRFSGAVHSPNAPYVSKALTLNRDVGTVQKASGTQTVTFGPLTKLFKKSKGIHISISLRDSEGKDPVSSNNSVTLYGCD